MEEEDKGDLHAKEARMICGAGGEDGVSEAFQEDMSIRYCCQEYEARVISAASVKFEIAGAGAQSHDVRTGFDRTASRHIKALLTATKEV